MARDGLPRGSRTTQQSAGRPDPRAGTHPVLRKLEQAILLHRQGRLLEAASLCEEVLKSSRTNVAALQLLGSIRHRTGRYGEAASLYEKAIRLQPDADALRVHYADTLRQIGRHGEAVASYDRAIAIDPGDPVRHLNRAIALHALQRFDDALAAYDRAIAIRPDYAQAYCNRGATLKELDRPEEARASFERAAVLQPDYASAHYNIGVLAQEQRRFDEALASYDRAIALTPGHAAAHCNRGVSLMALGSEAAAAESFRAAVRIRPDYAECYRNYASITNFKDDDPLLSGIKALAASESVSDSDRMHVHFALAKAEHDLGNSERAFEHWMQGNRIRKTQLGYAIAQDAALFAAIRAFFDGGDMEAPRPGYPVSATTPVFILGMPRSGTTLVERIVASHSGVFGAGELDALNRAVGESGWTTGHGRRATFDAVRARYLKELAGITDAPFVTDKMPLNFRWIGFIREALPEAKIVHLMRDPAAVCWSNFRMFFPHAGMAFTSDLADIARYHRLYRDLMAFWRARDPGAVYDLDYEALTEDQEGETRKLLAFLGLGWEDAVLNFHESEDAVTTASTAQVRRKMYRGSSREWRRYAPWLRPMLDILDE